MASSNDEKKEEEREKVTWLIKGNMTASLRLFPFYSVFLLESSFKRQYTNGPNLKIATVSVGNT